MSSLNKVMLIGNLGRDPDVRNTQDGKKIINMSIATSQRWRDKHSGEKVEKTEWHRVTIFNEHIADVAEKYLRKGSKCYIEGELQTRKWTDEKDGIERYTTEIILGNFSGKLVLLGGKDDEPAAASEGRATPRKGYNPQSKEAEAAKAGGDAAAKAKAQKDFDDDIPF